MQKWNDIVRAFGKTSEEARAIAGPGLPAPRKDGQDTEDEEDPLTAPQIMGMAEAFLDKIRKLKKRVANLPDDTDEAAKNYMKYRLATYKAAYLAAVAIMETCERIGTVWKLDPCLLLEEHPDHSTLSFLTMRSFNLLFVNCEMFQPYLCEL